MAEDEQQFKRIIAKKVMIKDINDGNYVKESGWTPSYIVSKENKKIARANILGVVISTDRGPENNIQRFVIDDGSAKINVRIFDNQDISPKINMGDSVLVIGKPREYNGEKYISPEIIKRLGDDRWLAVRKLELSKDIKDAKIPESLEEEKESVDEVIEEVKVEEKTTDKPASVQIYEYIKEKDKGNGISIELLIDSFKEFDVEALISSLLKEGEIFEIAPGMIKVLE